jgi:hypothetical protein
MHIYIYMCVYIYMCIYIYIYKCVCVCVNNASTVNYLSLQLSDIKMYCKKLKKYFQMLIVCVSKFTNKILQNARILFFFKCNVYIIYNLGMHIATIVEFSILNII